MAQRAVNRRFKRKLTKGMLQTDIESSSVSRHMWAYSMMKKYGESGDPDYPIPSFPCLEESVTEKIEHHYNADEWSCLEILLTQMNYVTPNPKQGGIILVF